MSDIMCSKCGENSYYKSGKANGKQRYKCKECGCHFTMKDRREKYSTKQRLAAVTLYRKGLSLRSIAEVIGANNVIVLYWIRNIGKFIKNTVLSAAVHSSKELEVIEVDELWHYVQKNRRSYGYCLLTLIPEKEVIAYEVGPRSVKTLKKLWRKVALFKPDVKCQKKDKTKNGGFV